MTRGGWICRNTIEEPVKSMELSMTREEALKILTNLKESFLDDCGRWAFGRDYTAITPSGLVTASFTVSDPITCVEVTKERLQELKDMFPKPRPGEVGVDANGEEIGFNELELEERLILYHNGKADTEYWAVNNGDLSDLDSQQLTTDYDLVVEEVIDQMYQFGEFIEWEQLDDELLIACAEQVQGEELTE